MPRVARSDSPSAESETTEWSADSSTPPSTPPDLLPSTPLTQSPPKLRSTSTPEGREPVEFTPPSSPVHIAENSSPLIMDLLSRLNLADSSPELQSSSMFPESSAMFAESSNSEMFPEPSTMFAGFPDSSSAMFPGPSASFPDGRSASFPDGPASFSDGSAFREDPSAQGMQMQNTYSSFASFSTSYQEPCYNGGFSPLEDLGLQLATPPPSASFASAAFTFAHEPMMVAPESARFVPQSATVAPMDIAGTSAPAPAAKSSVDAGTFDSSSTCNSSGTSERPSTAEAINNSAAPVAPTHTAYVWRAPSKPATSNEPEQPAELMQSHGPVKPAASPRPLPATAKPMLPSPPASPTVSTRPRKSKRRVSQKASRDDSDYNAEDADADSDYMSDTARARSPRKKQKRKATTTSTSKTSSPVNKLVSRDAKPASPDTNMSSSTKLASPSTSKAALATSERQHIPCPFANRGCPATFTRRSDLRRHIENSSVHPVDASSAGPRRVTVKQTHKGRYACARCGKKLSRKDALKRHSEREACGTRGKLDRHYVQYPVTVEERDAALSELQ
ncbi:hypothetical protein BD626DRAFT_473039 [Schizophyllum amplum]|uniref:C2H2-type domain-containing protein n=1 Tax=Schizophyllum amplum TaxID=97359 RepID=A0A550CWG6_9AGAR|nr:hypothetical protein BD626DRAFT_473039 [Auriculariopsis ampla]